MDECQLCHRPKDDHGPGKIRHKFVGLNDSMSLQEDDRPHVTGDAQHPASQGPVRSLLGGDPILRLALIRKGLITSEELDKIEQELKGAGIAVAEAVGKPRDR